MTVWSVEQLTSEARKHLKFPRARSTPNSRHWMLQADAGTGGAAARGTPRSFIQKAAPRPNALCETGPASRQSSLGRSILGRPRVKANAIPIHPMDAPTSIEHLKEERFRQATAMDVPVATDHVDIKRFRQTTSTCHINECHTMDVPTPGEHTEMKRFRQTTSMLPKAATGMSQFNMGSHGNVGREGSQAALAMDAPAPIRHVDMKRFRPSASMSQFSTASQGNAGRDGSHLAHKMDAPALIEQLEAQRFRQTTGVTQFNKDGNRSVGRDGFQAGDWLHNDAPRREKASLSLPFARPELSTSCLRKDTLREEKPPLHIQRPESSPSLRAALVQQPGPDGVDNARAPEFSATAPASTTARTFQEPRSSAPKLSRQLSMPSEEAMRQLSTLDIHLAEIEQSVEKLNNLARGALEPTAESVGKMRTELAQLEAAANKLEAKGVDNVYTSDLNSGREAAKEMKTAQLRRLESLFLVIETLFCFLALQRQNLE